MSNTNQEQSEVKQAAKQANPSEIQDNLDVQDEAQQAEDLDKDQKTEFIDDALRTDKK